MKAIKSNFLSRMLRLGLLILVQGLYLPLNRNLSGGYLTRIRLDDYIPVLPAWTTIYLIWLPLCAVFAFWAAWKMPEGLFRAYFTGAMATISVSMMIFFFFPTYVQRPEVLGNDMFSNILRMVYANDNLYNALPSGHVYLVVATAMFYLCWRSSRDGSLRTLRWDSWWTWFWIGMVILVCLSTIFTGQHSLIDIPAGFVVAILGYLFGRWWASRFNAAGAYETQNGS
jgi:membrane-associated phospholipid phosphatase